MDMVEGFILIGGASSRMGTDKSRLRIANETFVELIAKELHETTSRVWVVGRPEQSDSRLALVPDVHPQWGALGGVHAALASCSSEWALIVACDLPNILSSFFKYLLSLRSGVSAIAPIQADGRRQPLCAMYRVPDCLPQAETLIKSGERRPIALLQSVPTRWVEFSEYGDLPGAARFFDNINTPKDYELVSQRTQKN